MEDVYIVMLVALLALAITDLVVGVSNDAINFLNSAIGSKAVSMRTILIVASIGVAIGAIFSSGLMEVARKGIFLPQQFYFEEIMIIFMAVMITDVLLLDFFNSIGLPTSTTVSIVFELLGAAVSIAVIKIYKDGNDLSLLASYINTSKATEIIIGILMAVVIAFIVGLVVQYISRLIFSFQFERKMKYVGSIFGGASLTAILYFILIKGLKSVPYLSEDTLTYINENTLIIILIGFVFFSIISQLLMSLFKLNILRVIIVIGTFALALAFAGNDLVNFIGVPIAAWQSYNLWETAYQSSGTLPSEMLMSGLSGSVPTPEFLLIIAGGVMVVTLWFSSKAKAVVETGVNLARQGDGVERFEPNWLSRSIVRYSVMFSGAVSTAMPKAIKNKIDKKFEKPEHHTRSKRLDAPAFDMVRASVNLVVASILISIGTNLKLPLSTTYVTFMVAMGSSLADRAWDRESAVYRVAGVLNVIGGWFVTALVAFTAAAIFACIIYYGGTIALAILIILAVVLVVRSGIIHSRKSKEEKKNKRYNRTDIITINEITTETSENISSVIHGINRMYTKTVDNLGYHDLGKLKKNNKAIGKLEEEVDELKGNIFYFIKSLDDDSVEASKFYILILDYLQDMTQSIAFITRNSYNHVHNNHKNLKFNQIRDLKKVDERMQVLFDDIEYAFNNHEFAKIDQILKDKQELLDYVSDLIQKQINRIRTSETSPRNTKLYFGLLLETRDLITSTMSLLQLFQEFYREAKSTF
ncbi:MAG: phosphate:sodium symporter [Zunongwangia sp.]|uniref:Phosphate transporter n=1 Tax=Zunongwangia profunda TaxID=398743 RepID=A0A3D5J4T0_9FLAO|nr:inorganic phosphate transporter [Zunongwangia profunda]MAO34415.1 phosphate:sodium symporter [Zunongwangia sp.]MAS72529.1 phosphate:sodium symporter [Zunongwangia sp.]HAJ81211.1 phosphate:sodium symporter [Zunongwangia profunda]HCV82964.1 phosphate:sodium symporter [Zunongwangia profunda]